MTKRHLRPDELELWQQIARSTDPLHKHRPPQPKPKPLPKKASIGENNPKAITPFKAGQSAQFRSDTIIPPPTTADRLKQDGVSMDAKAFGRMKRGKLVPEGRLDLHGMTLDQAHGALVRYILTAQSRGFRLVLVITGKGDREDPYDPMPRRRGVLKTQVPLWLRMPPVAQAVLQVSEAHRKHGGGGAYYVYLRRRR
ncbi:Smr/MutS family protein [Thalassococcus lentus]|uniref:Smr/MutS family protein n=1 Tax=Thalassococcus lentus TaxID=1210524 RepID=A0ABT4XNA7_9RHOB|nr:Smr/MutS family protein [Thalassococcus lentus]MDA7423392.1 Smr/MutS family protein [Thalassococcus lentus]